MLENFCSKMELSKFQLKFSACGLLKIYFIQECDENNIYERFMCFNHVLVYMVVLTIQYDIISLSFCRAQCSWDPDCFRFSQLQHCLENNASATSLVSMAHGMQMTCQLTRVPWMKTYILSFLLSSQGHQLQRVNIKMVFPVKQPNNLKNLQINTPLMILAMVQRTRMALIQHNNLKTLQPNILLMSMAMVQRSRRAMHGMKTQLVTSSFMAMVLLWV